MSVGLRKSRHVDNYSQVGQDLSGRNALLNELPGRLSNSSNTKQLSGFRDDSDDDLEPPKLSELGQSVIERREKSPEKKQDLHSQPVSQSLHSKTPTPGNRITPGVSLRLKRIGLTGAPVRKSRSPPQYDSQISPSQDQENLPVMMELPLAMNSSPNPSLKQSQHQLREPAARLSLLPSPASNLPLKSTALSQSPPKMSALNPAATSASVSSKHKKKRKQFTLNGKIYPQIGSRIGTGGSSDVYRVIAENSEMFALKKVKLANIDEFTILGYKGEIDLLKKLDKEERIIRLYDFHIDDQKRYLYLLMELGESDLAKVLSQKYSIEQDAKLDLIFTRFYWREMLYCVAAIHAHNIIHSDLKPANFILVRGQVKLIDFGIADAIDIENTLNVQRDSHFGTINFMSPESLQDSSVRRQSTIDQSGINTKLALGTRMKIGKPSDVWSLGCILYQMVYGQAPFAHFSTMVQRALAIIDSSICINFPTTGIGGMSVPFELRQTMMTCLNRNPAARPTANDLLNENDLWLYPEVNPNLRISEDLLDQIIGNIARRFKDTSKPQPTDEEIKSYAPSFYTKIKEWS